jgi:hypothetical protein
LEDGSGIEIARGIYKKKDGLVYCAVLSSSFDSVVKRKALKNQHLKSLMQVWLSGINVSVQRRDCDSTCFDRQSKKYVW